MAWLNSFKRSNLGAFKRSNLGAFNHYAGNVHTASKRDSELAFTFTYVSGQLTKFGGGSESLNAANIVIPDIGQYKMAEQMGTFFQNSTITWIGAPINDLSTSDTRDTHPGWGAPVVDGLGIDSVSLNSFTVDVAYKNTSMIVGPPGGVDIAGAHVSRPEDEDLVALIEFSDTVKIEDFDSATISLRFSL